MTTLEVNATRLWSRLMAMAEIGATTNGGSNRPALSDLDVAGRDLFRTWCRGANLELRTDAIGNVFARRPGGDESLPPVLTGSHLDTQPTGGKFDGIYGVLAGLEVLDTLNDRRLATRHPIEVVVWTNEEGARFDAAMMGSAVWAGNLDLDATYRLADREGRSVAAELVRTGELGSIPASAFPVEAAFELHIEQGPILEDGELDIGIVTGVQHMSRHRLVIGGQEAHAGTTPMDRRRDPMRALAALLPKLYAMAAHSGPDARLTFGYVHAHPGSPNTVPGKLELTIDIRHPDAEQYAHMITEARSLSEEACAALHLPCTFNTFWEAPGVTFAPQCVAAVRQATEALGYRAQEMLSGAGHDACNVASVAPASMIFVPCKGGLSHNEAESITIEQAAKGANVLLHAILAVARR